MIVNALLGIKKMSETKWIMYVFWGMIYRWCFWLLLLVNTPWSIRFFDCLTNYNCAQVLPRELIFRIPFGLNSLYLFDSITQFTLSLPIGWMHCLELINTWETWIIILGELEWKHFYFGDRYLSFCVHFSGLNTSNCIIIWLSFSILFKHLSNVLTDYF